MAERCELCGAKVRREDETCRECGASLSDADAVLELRDITAVESPPIRGDRPAPADTNPELRFESPPTRKSRWLALVGVAAVVGAGGFVATQFRGGDELAVVGDAEPSQPVAAPPPAPPSSDDCGSIASLQGHWTFTTEVSGARVVQSSGLNGFYTLDVDVEGCSAEAELTKTGYSARDFSDARVQRATATLALDPEGFASAPFDLESSLGPQGTVEFSFVADGGELSGIYRQRGSRWDDGGLFGFLHGERGDSAPRELVAATEPCLTRCHVACGSALRELPAGVAERCVEQCTEDPSRPARCGDAQPVPEQYSLALEGPDSLAKHCKRIGGCANTKTFDTGSVPSLGADRLPDGWSEVTMVRGRKGNEAGVRMALHGPQGWWFSAPLFDAAAGSRVGKLRLYARALSEPERRYVLGLVRTSPSNDADEAYVACRLEDTPRCIRVVRTRGTLANALPEGNLSVAEGAA